MRNKYCKRSKISANKFRDLVRYYTQGYNATQISRLSKLNRNTVNRHLQMMRPRIAELCEREIPDDKVINVFESSLGFKEVQNKSGSANKIKTVFFGIFNSGSMIFTEILTEDQVQKFKKFFHVNSKTGSFENESGINNKYLFKLNNGKEIRIITGNALNVHQYEKKLSAFWTFTKSNLKKYKGIKLNSLYDYLKECEFMYNHQDEDRYRILLKYFRNHPLF